MEYYESDRVSKKREYATKILQKLLKIGYDFMKPSEYEYNDIKNLNTLEVLLSISVDFDYLKEILEYVWTEKKQRDSLMKMVQQVINKEGRVVDLFFEIRADLRSQYLNELSNFLNEKREAYVNNNW